MKPVMYVAISTGSPPRRSAPRLGGGYLGLRDAAHALGVREHHAHPDGAVHRPETRRAMGCLRAPHRSGIRSSAHRRYFRNSSIFAVSSLESGSTFEGKLATVVPSRAMRYLWKFHF